MAEIKKGNNEFYIEEGGEKIARIEYVPQGPDEQGKDIITVTHTVVDEAHGGKGLGKELVNKIAEYARAEDKKINAQCSYAHHVLGKDENKDLLV
ncbi:hypothetical protein A8F94_16035 [Bacillus sp. FJAT-27225]|uniref:GNAT family N-acetyltransferase n=1 Tax=Bacillus sp. FJAT-27225 TaxID=1743144 RepID=UPI00080C295C|nr:GNAT family N-acetyltransferase [Bacillus sp. FJAT-27225]OCA84225.1 hypothetical protein A8F94_16035 [Bacillus sp. FJAT-27225]